MSTSDAGGDAPGIRVRVGDVFRIPIDEDRVGYGQLMSRHPGLDLYIAVFEAARPAQEEPEIDVIVSGPIAFLAHSSDARIWHGRWPIIGRRRPDRARVPYPSFRQPPLDPAAPVLALDYSLDRSRPATAAEVPVLRAMRNYDPSELEHALRALHGLAEPDPESHEFSFEAMRLAAEIEV